MVSASKWKPLVGSQTLLEVPPRAVGHAIDEDVTDRAQADVDIAVREVALEEARVCLVEDVEEPGAELNLLALTDIEVLEERHIVIPAMRRPQVERRNIRAAVAESRNADGAKVHELRAEGEATGDLRVAREGRGDGAGRDA